MSKKIVRHEFVSVLIPANSTLTRFNLPDLPNLRNVHLFGVQVYTDLNLRKDIISQNPVLNSQAVLFDSFLTLVNYGGKEFLKQAPSVMFQSLVRQNQDKYEYEQDFKSFVGQKVNYPKSFIEFTAPPATVNDTAFVMSVYYTLPLEEEKRESGYNFGKKG